MRKARPRGLGLNGAERGVTKRGDAQDTGRKLSGAGLEFLVCYTGVALDEPPWLTSSLPTIDEAQTSDGLTILILWRIAKNFSCGFARFSRIAVMSSRKKCLAALLSW